MAAGLLIIINDVTCNGSIEVCESLDTSKYNPVRALQFYCSTRNTHAQSMPRAEEYPEIYK